MGQRKSKAEKTELELLMLKACPPNAKGKKTIRHLAGLIDVTPWAARKWILADTIPARRAKQIVDLSESQETLAPKDRVSLADFEKFVYA